MSRRVHPGGQQPLTTIDRRDSLPSTAVVRLRNPLPHTFGPGLAGCFWSLLRFTPLVADTRPRKGFSMLTLTGTGKAQTCDGVTRSDFMQVGALAAMGLKAMSCTAHLVRSIVFGVGLSFFAAQSCCGEEPVKHEPPDSTVLQQNVDEVHRQHAARFNAAKTESGKSSLVAALLRQGTDEWSDMNLRFALLQEAVDAAEEARNWQSAFQAIGELGRTHNFSMAQRATDVITALQAAKAFPTDRKRIINSITLILDRSVWNDDLDGAEALVGASSNLLEGLAETTEGAALQRRISGLPKAREMSSLALEALRTGVAQDPDTFTALGAYLCFYRKNWNEGLPALMRCGDPGLQDLATRESETPASTGERLALAHAWWDQLETQSPFATGRIKERAAYWYSTEFDGLSGASRNLVMSRLNEVSATFLFEGRGYILSQLKEFAPVSIEAWVQPDPAQQRVRWEQDKLRRMAMFVGSDIGGEFGLGIGIIDGKLHTLRVKGFYETKASVPGSVPSHVKVMYNQNLTYVFLNGKKVGECEATKPRNSSHFVMGTFGEQNNGALYRGRIRQVRIQSDREDVREFEPQLCMPVGDKTTLLYDALAVEGERVIDRTGHGNHGTLLRVDVEVQYVP